MVEKTMGNVSGKYQVASNQDYEPGSNKLVLKNYLSIKDKSKMEKAEQQELERTEQELLDIFDDSHQFTSQNICDIHELWLGDIYPFAGDYRSVNMSKQSFSFAAAEQIPRLMDDFENQFLKKYTPCQYEDDARLSYALAIVHVELIIIHPFREGNGRTARLLADLMAMQSNRPPLDYKSIEQSDIHSGFDAYVQSIHAGHCCEYEPMKKIFEKILIDTMN